MRHLRCPPMWYNEGVGLAPMHPIDGNPPPGEAPAVPTVWNGEGARLAPVHPINGDPLLGVAPAVPTDVVRWGCGARAYAPGQAPTVARLSAMKLGKVCKEVPPEWRDLCRACATERRTTSAQHDEGDRRIVFKAAHALCRINAANVSYGQGDGHD